MRVIFGVLMLVGALAMACSSGGGGGKVGVDTKDDGGWVFDTGKDTVDTVDVGDQGSLDTPAPLDTLPEVNDEGILAYCTHDENCAMFGLKCYKDGLNDPDPICSRECANNDECPDGSICKVKAGTLVCARPVYCDPCTTDGDCGAGRKCIADYKGADYCSPSCDFLVKDSCDPGSICLKDTDGTFCRPLFGACRENGVQCAQCTLDKDCQQGNLCHLNEKTREQYCAKVCQTKQECPVNFGCHVLLGETKGLCTMEFGGVPSETCKSGTKDFCYPCEADDECKSGVCYENVTEARYGCSMLCDLVTYPSNKGCPSGLFCVNGKDDDGNPRDVCMPSGAYFCQGFLNCVGVTCKNGEVCERGYCKPK